MAPNPPPINSIPTQNRDSASGKGSERGRGPRRRPIQEERRSAGAFSAGRPVGKPGECPALREASARIGPRPTLGSGRESGAGWIAAGSRVEDWGCCSPFPLGVPHYPDRELVSSPATSHAACGLPALRALAHFTTRCMNLKTAVDLRHRLQVSDSVEFSTAPQFTRLGRTAFCANTCGCRS